MDLIDQLSVINNNIPNEKYCNVNVPLILSYENQLSVNKNSMMFKKTLERYNWDYEFIGEGLKWNGPYSKVLGYHNYFINLNDDKIVVLSDARDVFCLRNSDFFIQQIESIIKDKIIISAEMFLSGHMNWDDNQVSNILSKNPNLFFQGLPVNNYWDYHNINPNPFRKYVNSGLIIGKVKHLKKAFEWIINNNIYDDQLGLSKYTNQFPHLVHLDFDANILHTSTSFVNGSLYEYNIQQKDTPTFNELLGFSSFFLHIPGINSSKGQQYIYDIIYKLFENKIIDKDMYDLYNIKKTYPIKDCFITLYHDERNL